MEVDLPDHQHNITYSTSSEQMRLVDECLRFLLQHAREDNSDIGAWFSQHCLAIYLPLASLYKKLKTMTFPVDVQPFDATLWQAFYDHLTYDGPPTTIVQAGLTTCHQCKEQILSAAHFNELPHIRKLMLQSFRFAPVGKPIWEHQLWMRDHRIGVGRSLRRVANSSGDVVVRFEYATNATQFGWTTNGTKAYASSHWRIGPADVFNIHGASVSRSLTTLFFSVHNRSPVPVQVHAPKLTDDPFDPMVVLAASRLNPGRQILVPVQLPTDANLGLKYYEGQFWISYRSDTAQEKFVAFSTIIQWEFVDPVIDQAICQALVDAPKKMQRSTANQGISRKPEARSAPPKPGDALEVNRVCKPVPIYHPILAPYFRIWQTAQVGGQEQTNRAILHGPADYPRVAGRTTEEVLSLLDLNRPIEIGTLPLRLLAELVGQVEYEEDDPKKVELDNLRPTVEADFSHLDRQESSREGAEYLSDTDCFYLTAVVPARSFDHLGLQSPLVRLVHPEWTYKYLVFIEGRQEDGAGSMKLILKINSGAKRAFVDHSGHILPRTQGLQLTPTMGPATEYQIALLLKVIFNQHRRPDEDDSDKQTRVVPREDDGYDSDSSVYLYSDEHPEAARIPRRPARAPDSPNEGESRCKRFERFFVDNWKKFFETYFCSELAHATKASWSFDTPNAVALDWLDDVQRSIYLAIMRQQAMILCKAPPGTGKTSCVARILTVLSLDHPGQKFLCLTSTNAAANILTERIIDCHEAITGQPPARGKIVRYLKKGYDLTTLSPALAKVTATRGSDASGGSDRVMATAALLGHQIIICTLDMAIMDIANTVDSYNSKQGDDNYGKGVFDLLVVDEAASVDLPRLAVLLPLAAYAQVILLGDIYQLPAYITNQVLQRYAAEESGMEFLLNLAESSPACEIIHLQRNYRSRPDLVTPPNIVVYKDAPMLSVPNPALFDSIEREKRVVPEGHSIAFRHIEGVQQNHGISLFNPHEIAAVCDIVHRLVNDSKVDPSEIGINGTYAPQTDLLKTIIGPRYPAIKISCANNWQGDERSYEIISLVRSDPDYDAFGQPHLLGFLRKLPRVNVSITRAKKINIFVCNVLHFLDQPLIRECLRMCCAQQAWMPPVTPAIMQYVHLRVCKAMPLAESADGPENALPHYQELIGDC